MLTGLALVQKVGANTQNCIVLTKIEWVLQILGEPKANRKLSAAISLQNPLPVPLTNCCFSVQGANLTGGHVISERLCTSHTVAEGSVFDLHPLQSVSVCPCEFLDVQVEGKRTLRSPFRWETKHFQETTRGSVALNLNTKTTITRMTENLLLYLKPNTPPQQSLRQQPRRESPPWQEETASATNCVCSLFTQTAALWRAHVLVKRLINKHYKRNKYCLVLMFWCILLSWCQAAELCLRILFQRTNTLCAVVTSGLTTRIIHIQTYCNREEMQPVHCESTGNRETLSFVLLFVSCCCL